jgi:leucyl-tRNA synthetase
VSETVEIAVQVNGKLRGTFQAAREADEKALEAAALAVPNVARYLENKTPRRVIIVKGRMVNVVV